MLHDLVAHANYELKNIFIMHITDKQNKEARESALSSRSSEWHLGSHCHGFHHPQDISD
jgi:hypothetical protein